MSGQALLIIRRPKLTPDGKHLLYDAGELQHDLIASTYVADGDEIVLLSDDGSIIDQRLIIHPEEHDDPDDDYFGFVALCNKEG